MNTFGLYNIETSELYRFETYEEAFQAYLQKTVLAKEGVLSLLRGPWRIAYIDGSRIVQLDKLVLDRHMKIIELTEPVRDVEKASAYLTADQMTDYLLDDYEVLKSARDRVFQIEWQLSTATAGNIVLVSKKPLTDTELDSIANWVMGQNSDGLGEGFEQQPFACYLNDDEYEADLEETGENLDFHLYN